MHFKKLLLALSLFLCSDMAAQDLNRDTSFYHGAVVNAIRSYESFVSGQEMYYNGSAYAEPPQTNEEHPFFLAEDFITGTLLFQGQQFDKIPMLYDIMLDEVVVESASSGLMLVTKKKLSAFTIGKSSFRRFDSTFTHSLPRKGFYQVIYDGKSNVICLRQKVLQESIEDRKLEIHFEEKNKFFILINGQYHPVRGRSAVLKLLSDKKSDLRKHISENKLDFKRNKETALASVAALYDRLTTAE